MKRVACCLLALGALPLASTAAQEVEPASAEIAPAAVPAEQPRGVVEAELALYRGEQPLVLGSELEGYALSSWLGARYRVLDPLELELGWGFTYAKTEVQSALGSDDDRGFRSANPWLGANWVGVLRVGAPMALRIGLGLALPAAKAVDEPLEDHAEVAGLLVAPGMRGAWDLWRWLPDTLGIAVSSSLVARPHPVLALRASLGLGFLAPVRQEDGEDRDLEIAAQLGVDLAVLPVEHFTIGMRLQGVILTVGDDQFQSALEPFVGVEVEQVLLRLGLMINLDEPYGTGFGAGDVWALRLSGSARF
ncbi:MAG TPA: hypothetical protein RMH85_25385 [Polyangiaceae bacterium LLY-WYZ-15_(1-7)]|nr:hypothetical protein [Myxococcales bacterium]MAT25806.1 hypothetical protein [Sandaracinus sp.]HJL04389.1 hypothetical protein [Polyangiaceae bacterium LLY-WYZ-15_(1-7)]MBJ70712.1 hypothetical protein [Sandaracinus sp.]HJL11834.1 hypothetical protein [Polyangiaceae bacterium LLY-WYZ-15_(1-7)]